MLCKFLKKNILCFFILCSTVVFSQDNIFEISRTGTAVQMEEIYKSKPELIYSKNEHGYSPLTLACYNGNLEVVKFLVSKLDTVNEESKYGTPLMAATYKGFSDIVKVLLDKNADTNLQDDKGETVGHYAVFFKKYDIIKLLVEAKANFEIKNQRNQTAIDYANMYKDEQINKLLNL